MTATGASALSFLSAEAQAELKALIEQTVAEALGKQRQAKWVTVKEDGEPARLLHRRRLQACGAGEAEEQACRALRLHLAGVPSTPHPCLHHVYT